MMTSHALNRWQQFATLYDPDSQAEPRETHFPPSGKGECSREIVTMEFNNRLYRKYRLTLLERNPHCFYCGAPITELNSSLDHVIPECRGGLSSPGNLQLCCLDCNCSKGDATPVEWLADLKAKIAKVQELGDKLEERIESESLADFQAPQERSTGPKGKGGRPSGGPSLNPDWHIPRQRFQDGKSQYCIVHLDSGKILIRGLKLQDAVYYFRAVGVDDALGMIVQTPLYQQDLGLKRRPSVDYVGGETL